MKISARGTLTNKILCLCFNLVTSTKKPSTATRLLINPKTRLNVVTDCQKSICHHSLLYFCNHERLEHSAKSPELFGKGVQGNPPAGVPGELCLGSTINGPPVFPPFPTTYFKIPT